MTLTDSLTRPARIRRTSRDGGDTAWSRIDGRGATKIYVRIRPAAAGGFEDQVREIYRKLQALLWEEGAGPENVVSEKVFFRRLEAQVEAFRHVRDDFYAPWGASRPATTYLHQPPCGSGADLELQARVLFAAGPDAMTVRDLGLPEPAAGKIVSFRGYEHVYLHNLSGGVPRDGLSYRQQMERVFDGADRVLTRLGMSFQDVIRTWIYLVDMERDYADLNRARNAFFERIGLARIPASTGIQGGVYPCDRGGSMDLYAFRTERPVEVEQMHARTLNEAWDYGSSFARGMRVTREDRTVLYLSGTASVDTRGEVVHVGDIEGQVHRMLLNVEELLAGSGAGPSDVIRATTYLKYAEDFDTFRRVYAERGFPSDLPHTICHADVCRPDWLVEIEVAAILPA
jgi:enamine deaminase RidA (YjgF/YER057c/UK114 family)